MFAFALMLILHSSISTLKWFPLVKSVCLQILHDTFSEACIRITQEDRQKMKALLGKIKRHIMLVDNIRLHIYNTRLYNPSQPGFNKLSTLLNSWERSGSGLRNARWEREEESNCLGQRFVGNLLLPPFPGLCEFWSHMFSCVILVQCKKICVCVFQGSVGTGVQVLSVSHKGIRLLKMVRSSSAAPDYFRVLRPYRWECVNFCISFPCLQVMVTNKYW